MNGEQRGPQVETLGSLAEEAGRLFGAAQDWLRRTSERGELAAHTQSCVVCPVCQLIAVLRGDRPDLTARIGEITSTVLAAVQDTLAGHPEPAEPQAAPEDTQHTASRPTGRFERIDLNGTA